MHRIKIAQIVVILAFSALSALAQSLGGGPGGGGPPAGGLGGNPDGGSDSPIQVTPTTLTFNAPPGGPNPPNQTLTLKNGGSDTLSWSVSDEDETNPNNNTDATWLTEEPTSGILASSQSTLITVKVNVANLAEGTYKATIHVSDVSSSFMPTNVSVTLNISPSAVSSGPPTINLSSTSLTFSAQLTGPNPDPKTVTLKNSGGGTLSWTITGAPSGLSVTPSSGNLSSGAQSNLQFSVTIGQIPPPPGSSALQPGTYTAQIKVNAAGATNTPQTITVAILLSNSSPNSLAITPAGGFSPSGSYGGPFTPSQTVYTIKNGGTESIDWSAEKTQPWLSLSSSSGTLAGGKSVDLAFSLNLGANSLSQGTYKDTVTFKNLSVGNSIARTVLLSIGEAGPVVVEPDLGWIASGANGRFSPVRMIYTVFNPGFSATLWSAEANQNWITLFPQRGTLAPGQVVEVIVSINENAKNLAAQALPYEATVTFTDRNVKTTRPVKLRVGLVEGPITVSPGTESLAAGPVGGPFTPAGIPYTVRNEGQMKMLWKAIVPSSASWLNLAPSSGTLDPNSSVTVTASFKANNLTAGNYSVVLTFSNESNGLGTTARTLNLCIGGLGVSPIERLSAVGPPGGPFTPATGTYAVTNHGTVPLAWKASTIRPWLTASPASGTIPSRSAAMVSVSINANAKALAQGTYAGDLLFVNTTNDIGTARRTAMLILREGSGQAGGSGDNNVKCSATAAVPRTPRGTGGMFFLGLAIAYVLVRSRRSYSSVFGSRIS